MQQLYTRYDVSRNLLWKKAGRKGQTISAFDQPERDTDVVLYKFININHATFFAADMTQFQGVIHFGIFGDRLLALKGLEDENLFNVLYSEHIEKIGYTAIGDIRKNTHNDF